MLDVLNRKISQIYEALGQLESTDISSVKPEQEVMGNRYHYRVDFSKGRSEAELANAATLLITNIACIKDHLKSWCESNGTAFEGDALINSDINVAIIHDLWNIDKHAKLNIKPRSGHIPKIVDLKQSLCLFTGKKADSISPEDMYTQTGFKLSGGSATLAITGTVIDEYGNILGDFSDICQKAVSSWKKILVKAGVQIPPE